jgi:hypothetical protein
MIHEQDNPPWVMFHAACTGANSLAENLSPVILKYRIYAIDNIGEGNKSMLNESLIYPANGEEIADLYANLLNKLNIEHAPIFGASNGG